MVTIINYGLGNIQAFYHIYTQLNLPVKIASSVHDLSEAKKIILPGVGSFDWAMNKLNNSGMRYTLDQLVLEKEIPVLGVCIGMQMLAKSSEEGELPGLNWIDGVVKRFDEQSLSSKNPLPHMGW
ncbi:MAG: imidazole glycerol phosphate synthase subunit HisH, partial [Synechococcales cyanobacterium]